MSAARPLSKARATSEARRHLQLGYYADGATRSYVRCPRCRGKVAAERLPWQGPTAGLLSALTGHLLDEHATDAAQVTR